MEESLRQLDFSISLDEVLDLHLTDVFILQNLIQFTDPVPRTLFLEFINSCCVDQKMKEIPTSSFYHRLGKLLDKNFIAVKGKGKNQLIYETELTRDVLKAVNNIAMRGLYSTDINNQSQETTPQLISKVGLTTQLESLLIVNSQDMLNFPTFSMIGQLTKHLYLLANDTFYSRLLKFSQVNFPSEITQTRFVDGKIREADNFFDATLVIEYNQKEKHHGYSSFHWLTEAIRTTKPGGLVATHAISDFPDTDRHVLLDCVLDDIQQGFFTKVIRKEDLSRDLNKSGLENVQVDSVNGILLGWGRKPQE